jgi:hypothetical protein
MRGIRHQKDPLTLNRINLCTVASVLSFKSALISEKVIRCRGDA